MSAAPLNPALARMQALDQLLEQALLLEAAEREQWLLTLDSSDPDSARELRRLLSAAGREDPLLDGARWGRLAAEFAHSHQSGGRVGNYVLERQLGIGGMGEVWLARVASEAPTTDVQPAPVAIKLIRSSLSRALLSARLKRERDILMRLAHPGIARLLDSGISAEGEPYLVLEYVEGQPLLAFAAERALNLSARLALFVQICDAVAAAQARLIVHRDIKPQNVLVTADGRAKLLDFGIAKLLDDSGFGNSTELTAQLGRAMTPAYAAPEQVHGESVTTATDVYSLGVLLHELLLGQRPQRVTPDSDITLPSKLARRASVSMGSPLRPTALAVALRGDLDCLLKRALELAPNARYDNAAALLSDVQAYLGSRPLLAQPDSAGYRIAKLVARHPLITLTLSLAMAAVLIASAVAWQQSLEARREAARAAYVQSFLAALFSNDLPGAPRDQLPTTAELLKRGSDQALADANAEPGARLALLLALARIQVAQREFDGANAGLLAARALLPKVSDAPAWQRAAIEAELADLSARRLPGNRAQGVDALRAAITQAQALNAPHDWLVGALISLANAELDLDEGDAARASTVQAKAVIAQMPNPSISLRLSVLTQAVAAHTFDQQYRPAAEDDARAALKLASSSFGEQHAETAYASMRLALVLRIKGELENAQREVLQAVRIARAAYPDNHPQLARILEEAARIALRLNQTENGIALWREVLAIRRAQLSSNASAENDYAVLRTEAFLASALLRTGEYANAAELALHAANGLSQSVGKSHPLWLDAAGYGARALIELNRPADALAILPSPIEAIPITLSPTTRWRFLELQLIAASAQGSATRATTLQALTTTIAAETQAPRDIGLLLLSAANIALENQLPNLAQQALAASKQRLIENDPTHLLDIHQLLLLLTEKNPDASTVQTARNKVEARRSSRHFAVRLADKWLKGQKTAALP